MKNKKVIILLIIIVIIILTIGLYLHFSKSKDEKTVNEVSEVLNSGDPEKVIVTVNDEEIKEKDINYKKLVNENINEKFASEQKNTDYESLKKEVINDKILLQEASKNNIDIDEDEKETVRKMSEQAINETDKKIAEEIGLTEDEYLQYSIEKQIETRVIEKMREKITRDIMQGNINIDDKEFNKDVEELKKADTSEKYDILQKAYDRYIEYLTENSKIE